VGSAQEQAVVGETPNLAARLQAIAEPNTVTKIAGQSVRADAPRRIAARRECHARNLLGLVQFACLIVFC
jgi:class 3 adenylate cyclase